MTASLGTYSCNVQCQTCEKYLKCTRVYQFVPECTSVYQKSTREVPEVYEPIYPMVDNDLLQTLEVEHVRKQEWTFESQARESFRGSF